MKTIEELEHDTCRWPMAEFDRGELLFCGEPVARSALPRGGCQYCREHMVLAYRKLRVAGRAAAVQCDRQRLIELAAAI
jgi:hypothetical protein